MADNSSESSENSQGDHRCENQTARDSTNKSPEFSEDHSTDHESDCMLRTAKFKEGNYSYSPGKVLSPSRLANNPFAVKTTLNSTRSSSESSDNRGSLQQSNKVILRPSALDAQTSKLASVDTTKSCSGISFKLHPPVLTNPFAKCDSFTERRPESQELTSKDSSGSNESGEYGNTNDQPMKSHPCISAMSESSCLASSVSSGLEETKSMADTKFPSLITPNQRNSFSQAAVSTSVNFVFGQKMDERVTNVNCKSPNGTTNGTPELTFIPGSSSDQSESEGEKYNPNGDSAKPKSLEESAEEYESRQTKRVIVDEVKVITGEEEESNVLQVNCKLFAFDKITSSWLEKGRGLLRLNDKELHDGSLQSRLVIRTQGSLRVVLNTKIWSGMTVDRPSQKTVRITAMETEGIKVFVIMASPKDIEQLFNGLNWRVASLRAREEQRSSEKRINEDLPSSQPSGTFEDRTSPKKRKLDVPDACEDSCSSDFGSGVQDSTNNSVSRSNADSLEDGSENTAASSS